MATIGNEQTSFVGIFLRGLAMGAADIVPGVSGGTIAFITGIYQRLLNSIQSFHPRLFRVFKEQGIAAVWQQIDGTFIVYLLSGIFVSILSLVRVMSFLLTEYPSFLWAFFFGLILSACYIVGRQVSDWKPLNIFILIVGSAVALFISLATPTQVEPTLWLVFFAGSIAICAMILPGISGSFILLLMGMYTFIIEAVKSFEFVVLGVFAVGCILGLLMFARVLNYLLLSKKDQTLALLIGFMLGSLNTLWPWKHTLTFRTNSKGESVPFIQDNVLPATYQQLTGTNAEVVWVVGLVLAGIGMVLLVDKLAHRSSR